MIAQISIFCCRRKQIVMSVEIKIDPRNFILLVGRNRFVLIYKEPRLNE